MPASAILTPFSRGKAVEVGKHLFRKKLLPVGRITYEGQEVRFDRPFLETLLSSWQSGAYDQVPLQFATADNKHNNLPERTRGQVVSMDLDHDGLYVTVSATDEGAKVIKDNPNLGVSARIVNGLKRADDKFFAGAIQHVLGTLDPQINQLGPWEAIEASRQEGEVVLDLSAVEYQEDGVAGRRGQPQLSDEELTRLRAFLDDTPPGDVEDAVEQPEDAEPEDELSDEELADIIAAAGELEAGDGSAAPEGGEESEDLTDAEIAALLEEPGALEQITASTDPATVRALELANAQLGTQREELDRVTTALDEGRYEQERAYFAREYGIPPYITDLARPVLEGDGHVIELSRGQGTADVGSIVRQVLLAVGEQVKMLDLSSELGSVDGPDQDKSDFTAREQMIKEFRAQTGV
jgi:hypothetical protein